jgi:hypothetical protein
MMLMVTHLVYLPEAMAISHCFQAVVIKILPKLTIA